MALKYSRTHLGEPWRRLVWRFYWRGKPKLALSLPSPIVIPLHFSHDGTGYPLCNATMRERWTVEFKAVTCSACLEQGMPIVLQRQVNTR